MKAGNLWVPDKIPPYDEDIDVETFPPLHPDWLETLTVIRAWLVKSCESCAPPEDLCADHTRKFNWLIRMARANIPARYWPLEVENTVLEEQRALEFVRTSCAKIGSMIDLGLGVSLFGGFGCGKTTLSVYLLKAAIREGYSGFFTLMESLLTIIKDSFDDDWERKRYMKLRRVNMLVIDDLGKEHLTGSGFVVSRLDELLRMRDSMGLSTVFSSNLSREQVAARYGDGIISVLSNTNKPLWVEPGDLRRKLNQWEE